MSVLTAQFPVRTLDNGIEGFWNYAKNWLYPFRGVPRKHLHLFPGEICYRFNHRSEDFSPSFINCYDRRAGTKSTRV